MTPTYRILSIDGGGIRGLLAVVLLERLEAACPGFLAQVDLFAGTSTGGLIALALASGRTPAAVRALYERCGRKVFADHFLDNLFDLGNTMGAQYSIGPLKALLDKEFGQARLRELPKRVLISSFDLDNGPQPAGRLRTWKAKFFHNYPGRGAGAYGDGGERVVDVAVRTSAAPTYFPIYQGYVDGGVVANNPSMCAVAQALHPATGGQVPGSLALLSLGTGQNPHHLVSQEGDWGILQWAPHLIDLVMEGGAGLVDYQCRQLLGQRYCRLNPLLPFPVRMDRSDQMPGLVEIAKQADLSSAIGWLRAWFEGFHASTPVSSPV